MGMLLSRIVKSLQSAGVMITQVACGARHSLALTTGKCFVSYIAFVHKTSVEIFYYKKIKNMTQSQSIKLRTFLGKVQ